VVPLPLGRAWHATARVRSRTPRLTPLRVVARMHVTLGSWYIRGLSIRM
jgi:hypothetical protein